MAVSGVSQSNKLQGTEAKVVDTQKKAVEEKAKADAAAQKDLLVLSQEAKTMMTKASESRSSEEAGESKAQEMKENESAGQ